MNAVKPDDLTRLLECKVCEEIFSTPKLLDCLHSFCEKCLQLTDENNVVCENCGSVTHVTDGINGLSTNHFMLKLAGSYGSVKKSVATDQPIVCSGCENEEATFFCNDCHQFICVECKDAHSRIRITQNHRILRINDIKNGLCDISIIVRSANEECSKHDGEAIRFFCKTCDLLVCRDCLLCDNHLKQDHVCVCVKDVRSSCQEELNESLECVRQKENDLVIASEEIESLLDEIERVISEEESRVNLEAVQHIRAIEEERERSLKAIRSKKDSHVAELSKILEKIDSGIVGVTDLTSFSNSLIEFGQTVDILSIKDSIITRAKELAASISIPTIPCHLSSFDFSSVSDQDCVEMISTATQTVETKCEDLTNKMLVRSFGTSTDDLEVNARMSEEDIVTESDNEQVEDKPQQIEGFSIIEDNMTDAVREFVIDIITSLFPDCAQQEKDILTEIKMMLENKLGSSWHVLSGEIAYNISPLHFHYAVLMAGHRRVIVFCTGSDHISKQTIDHKVLVVETDMVETMKRDVVRFSKQAISRYTQRSDIAKNIAEVFSRKHGGKWQCLLMGKSIRIGISKLPIATNSCMHFTIGSEIVVLLKLASR